MNSLHHLPLGNGKQKRPAPLSDITQYVNMDIHRNSLTAEDKQKENNYKTVMCKSWIQNGSCTYGKKCRFAHGEHELREPARLVPEQHKTKLCEKYTVEGICPYGKRCNYIHPTVGAASGLQQPAVPAHFQMGYPSMMYAVPGMYGNLAGPPCYPFSLMPNSNCTRRADDLAHFYGQQPTLFEENSQQFPRLMNGFGASTGRVSRLMALSDTPWNDGGQAAMPMMCDLLGNLNGPSKPRAPLLPLVSRNEAGRCSAGNSYLTNNKNMPGGDMMASGMNHPSVLADMPWNSGGQMQVPTKCDLLENLHVTGSSKPCAPFPPLVACNPPSCCSASNSHPAFNNSLACAKVAPDGTSKTFMPESFTSSLDSDIWSPEKRMKFDLSPERVLAQAVGDKLLEARDERAADCGTGLGDNFSKWIDELDDTSKAQGISDEFEQWLPPSEKKQLDDGTAPGEHHNGDSLFRGLFNTDCFSLWKA